MLIQSNYTKTMTDLTMFYIETSEHILEGSQMLLLILFHSVDA